jgi:membrane-associated phospholipid phosphatase
VIIVMPGLALWNLAAHAAWLAPLVIAVTAACAVVTPVLVALCWRTPGGLRCVLAVVLGLAVVIAARHVTEALVFVPRPFVADHFRPLFPHARDSSFPSATAGYFAAAAVPVLACWRRMGWVLVGIAAEVAWGCVYVGVHYVTDVAAGLAIGAAGGGAAWLALGAPGAARLRAAADAGLRAARLRPRAQEAP